MAKSNEISFRSKAYYTQAQQPHQVCSAQALHDGTDSMTCVDIIVMANTLTMKGRTAPWEGSGAAAGSALTLFASLAPYAFT